VVCTEGKHKHLTAYKHTYQYLLPVQLVGLNTIKSLEEDVWKYLKEGAIKGIEDTFAISDDMDMESFANELLKCVQEKSIYEVIS